MNAPRYIVGIDLGTTNCAVAFADTAEAEPRVRIFPVPQLVAPGEVEARDLLPSFLYLPSEVEFPAGSLDLAWPVQDSYVVGQLARSRGAEVPSRLVSSAKSWLSHAGVNRLEPILPWKAPREVLRISPVGAQARLLDHIRDAWNHVQAGTDETARLERQEVLITVPASFDAAARELTLRAAASAGLPEVRLLEEPQAAFYAWIDARAAAWRRAVRVGDLVLVCDVGGGTTDFSLIAVGEQGGDLDLERVAVGSHILLGGDNMDLALAAALRERLKDQGVKIDGWQVQALAHAARGAKEELLSDPARSAAPVTILGRGSGVVAGTITTDLGRADVDELLLEGFLPACDAADWPRRKWRLGFRELGLAYETEPAVTRHLAAFLGRQAQTSAPAGGGLVCPSAVLFNGGVMKAELFRRRILDVLAGWAGERGREPPRALASDDLDLAVARGAATYGLARRGHGVRIRSGTARSYYLGIEIAAPAVPGMAPPVKALCVAPFGMEEGSESEVAGQEFGLVVGEPVEFPVFSSTERREDPIGTVLEEWGDELEPSPPLETRLDLPGRSGEPVPVRLLSRVTETGVLEIWCAERDGEHRWKLEFNLREQE